MPVLRADLHHHCDVDPVDHLTYSAVDLIDRARSHGIQAMAITPHGSVFESPTATQYARDQGVLLINGIEKMIEDREVVLLNVRAEEIPRRMTFQDLAELRSARGASILVMAPHPFYPRPTCVGPVLDTHADLFDAVEYAHLYTWFWNPNRAAVAWAKAHGKAVLANTDTHDLSALGRNYTEIEAEGFTVEALFSAIRAGRTRLLSRPPNPMEWSRFIVGSAYQVGRRLWNSSPGKQ
ncbi:MAG: hypothetical protein OHK005_15550 [Candidatus Methylacidiphilales bacterium]